MACAANASWRPKTKWGECDMVDVAVAGKPFRVEALEKEMQAERERRALILKAGQKVQQLSGTALDPRDSGVAPTG